MKLRVKEICKSKGITMEQVAMDLGITPNTLTRNINGNPTIATLEKIAAALDVSIVELFEPEGELYGIIQHKGVTYRIDSRQALEDAVFEHILKEEFTCTKCGEKYKVFVSEYTGGIKGNCPYCGNKIKVSKE
jgi:transcriptional regulator with XRE-family HTH domain